MTGDVTNTERQDLRSTLLTTTPIPLYWPKQVTDQPGVNRRGECTLPCEEQHLSEAWKRGAVFFSLLPLRVLWFTRYLKRVICVSLFNACIDPLK